MEFISGGFLLVEPCIRAEYMNAEILPELIYTASPCICNIYPSEFNNDEEKFAYINKLDLSDNLFENMNGYLEQLLKEKNICEEFFQELEHAHYFKNKYLNNIQNVKIIEIGTTTNYISDFFEEICNNNLKSIDYFVISRNLNRMKKVNDNNKTLGFDILGFEGWGSFHSFICNSLENVYKEKFGMEFTKFGLIKNYDDAVKASEYNNFDPNFDGEPVLWQPWIVNEIIV